MTQENGAPMEHHSYCYCSFCTPRRCWLSLILLEFTFFLIYLPGVAVCMRNHNQEAAMGFALTAVLIFVLMITRIISGYVQYIDVNNDTIVSSSSPLLTEKQGNSTGNVNNNNSNKPAQYIYDEKTAPSHCFFRRHPKAFLYFYCVFGFICYGISATLMVFALKDGQSYTIHSRWMGFMAWLMATKWSMYNMYRMHRIRTENAQRDAWAARTSTSNTV